VADTPARGHLTEGARLDRYELVSVVAEGGMGRVWLGRLEGKHGFAKLVAVKTVLPELAADPRFQKMFLDEARILSAIHHPNVAQILDLGESEGVLYLVMEWVDGTTLRRVADAVERLPLGAVLRMTSDACAGLHAVHELRDADGRPLGVVHRDVSPHNVMVSRQGTTKLIDFGIAKARARLTEETTAGIVKGKHSYMAPEQAAGFKTDRRADLWAMGAVLLRLVCGDEERAQRIVARLLEDNVLDLPEELPEPVQRILRRTLAIQPSSRFATAEEMGRAVDVAMEELGERTSTQQVAERLAAMQLLPAPPAPPVITPSGVAERSTRVDGQATRTTWWSGRIAGIATVVIAVASVVVLVLLRVRSSSSTSPADGSPAGSSAAEAGSSAPTDAANAGTAVTALPLPDSASREAVDTYRTAMQQYRDGAHGTVSANFRRALSLDPNLAAAHLRLAMFIEYANPTLGREHYAKATALRASLSPHDQALLEAYAPVLQQDPSNYGETTRRLAAAEERFPRDAELAYWRAVVSWLGADSLDPSSAAAFDDALAFDPAFGMAYATKVETLSYVGALDEARRVADACLRSVPTATQCLYYRETIEREEGECGALAADARQQIAVDPTAAGPYAMLAEALEAQGSPLAAVTEMLAQERAHARQDARQELESLHAFAIAVLQGDFALAERTARDHERLAASESSRTAHGRVARELVELYREEGNDAAAATVAADFLARKDGWVGDPRSEDIAIAHDVVPVMLAALRRAHKLTAAEVDAKRADWFAEWHRLESSQYAPYVWLRGYAATVDSPESAAAALGALRGLAPPRFAPETLGAADTGRTYALAGRRDDALPWLRRGAGSCAAIEFPIAHTRAQVWLGAALEADDRAGACDAYRRVLARWGSVRPRSVTADEARARANALQCAP
jgi:serine/threonine protein kinase